MNKFNLFAFLCFSLLLTINISAQKWETFEAKEYNLKINVPQNWSTSTGEIDGIPYLESVSPDETVYLMIYVYQDASISTEQLLDNAVNDLGIALEGEATNRNLNGMDAWVAEAGGVINDDMVGLYVAAATYDVNNYVAYIFTGIDFFEKNYKVMNQIIESMSPIKK